MGANTRDIRRRIKSVKNTAQITKAMQMVAASKMRKAQMVALASRPYAEELARMMRAFGSVMQAAEDRVQHALMEVRPVRKQLVVVISTDKGLCGPLNANLFREITKFDPAITEFIAVGKKGGQFLSRMNRRIIAEFELKDAFTFFDTKAVSKMCIERFLSGSADAVHILYTDFINTLQQVPASKALIPVTSLEVGPSSLDGRVDEYVEEREAEEPTDYILEPSLDALLDSILPHFVDFKIYHMVLESRASEHSARMVAMKNATDNAKQIIKDLTLEYNKVRQASITTEILEIATAQMVLG
jgi:F-type H+-transporting ATPase subunit gamma